MAKIIVDAENSIRGRVASFAAKQALQGNEIAILNCEKALITGRPVEIVNDFKTIRRLNTIKPEKGPFLSRSTDKMMKRTIRGMLPDYRLGRGREAWKKIKCYVGIPDEFKNEKAIKIKTNAPSQRFMSIQELSTKA